MHNADIARSKALTLDRFKSEGGDTYKKIREIPAGDRDREHEYGYKWIIWTKLGIILLDI